MGTMTIILGIMGKKKEIQESRIGRFWSIIDSSLHACVCVRRGRSLLVVVRKYYPFDGPTSMVCACMGIILLMNLSQLSNFFYLLFSVYVVSAQAKQ